MYYSQTGLIINSHTGKGSHTENNFDYFSFSPTVGVQKANQIPTRREVAIFGQPILKMSTS